MLCRRLLGLARSYSTEAQSELPHNIRVTRLYRHALRQSRDWAYDRDVFCEEGAEIRQKFEDNRHQTDLSISRQLVREGEARLNELAHPDPYACE